MYVQVLRLLDNQNGNVVFLNKNMWLSHWVCILRFPEKHINFSKKRKRKRAIRAWNARPVDGRK